MTSFECIIAAHDRLASDVARRAVGARDATIFASAQMLARGQQLCQATLLLLTEHMPEAAAITARAAVENAAALHYIASRGPKQAAYARLYLLSEWGPKHIRLEQMRECGAPIPTDRDVTAADIDRWDSSFCRARTELWEGARNSRGEPRYSGRHNWNGLKIADTFDQAGIDCQYQVIYRCLSAYVHCAADSHLAPEQSTTFLPGLVRHGTLVAACLAMSAVEQLLGTDAGVTDADVRAAFDEIWW